MQPINDATATGRRSLAQWVFALGLALCVQPCYTNEANTLVILIVDAQGKPAPNTVVIAQAQRHSIAANNASERYFVDQVDLAFKPHVTLVPTGKPVFFPNSDRTRHHVYSFSEPNKFELKLYREKDAPPVVFASEGIVELGCNIHDSMKGYIYVSNAPVQTVSGDDGIAHLELDAPPLGNLPLQIWHPQMGAKGASNILYDVSTNLPLRLNFELQNNDNEKPSSLKERLQQFKKHHD